MATSERARTAASDLTSIEGMEQQSAVSLDPDAHAYIAGGAGEGRSLVANRSAFDRYRLAPAALVDVSEVSTATRLLTSVASMPIGVAPMAGQILVDDSAEVAMARAAGDAGVPFCMPCVATAPLSAIPSSSSPRWYQIYVGRDRGAVEASLADAANNGFDAVMVTIDMRVPGNRPAWEGVPGRSSTASEHVGELHRHAQRMDRAFGFPDLEWLRRTSDLPLIVKGVLRAEDARRAAEHGASAVVVSNHGGRQLDRAVAPLDMLPEIVDAVDDEIEVYVDGGFRSGEDVAIALALGARAVLVGRPIMYATAIHGSDGARHALDLLRGQLETTMALLGATSVADLSVDHLRCRTLDGRWEVPA